MGVDIEDAKAVAGMRRRMVENMSKDLPAEHGIDRDELKTILAKVRTDRSLGDSTGSKAKAKAPIIPMDLDAFMQTPVKE